MLFFVFFLGRASSPQKKENEKQPPAKVAQAPNQRKATPQNEAPDKPKIARKNAKDEFQVMALKVFNAADKDGSGYIDEHELYELLQQLLGSMTLPESNRIYHEMDKNKSGTITIDESEQRRKTITSFDNN